MAFLLLGAGIFYLYQLVAEEPPKRTEIIVSQGQVQALTLGFEKVWQRSPSEEESATLIENYIREEVLYREALAMGLDREDAIIKRRMRQKIEFLTEDIADLNTPDEQDLQDFLTANQNDYLIPAEYDLRHVFINVSARGQAASQEAERLLKALEQDGSNYEDLGDQLMIPRHFRNVTAAEISRAFGQTFTNALGALPVGVWQGPVTSGYGIHLVHIDTRVDERPARIDEVQVQLRRDWALRQRQDINEAYYAKLRSGYDVTIEDLDRTAINKTTLSEASN